MRAAIVGAGVGGLATAIALRLRGLHVTVFERAPELTEIGAGLQISPNGMRVLSALGVGEAVAAIAFKPEAIEMRLGVSGRRVFRLDLAQEVARWGASYIHIHRADLVDILAARLHELAGDVVRLNTQVQGYADGTSLIHTGGLEAFDLIVGADGLHSALRTQMHGRSKPRYTGNLAWRAVVPKERLKDLPPPTACIWAGHKRHAVTTYIRQGTLVNFVGMVEEPEPSEEGWRIEGTREDVLRDFGGWCPTIDGILNAADTFHRWALFDRPPLPYWSDAGVVLIGDAAHPMLPSMAQGAVQALEDAWLLAAHLDKFPDRAAALAAFYRHRIDRVTRIQRGSVTNARIFHKASGLGRSLFYTPLGIVAAIAPRLFHRRQDWVYAYDILEEF